MSGVYSEEGRLLLEVKYKYAPRRADGVAGWRVKVPVE